MNIYINLAVEDILSEAVLRRVLNYMNQHYMDQPLTINACYGKEGLGFLKRNINAYNSAARVNTFLVLVDLDRNLCPPQLIQDWLNSPPNPNFLFRVAVREVEAWLLADRKGLAEYLGIHESHLPHKVEQVNDPKQVLINIARKSRKKALRDGIVPRQGSTSQQGPDYNGAMIHFVNHYWNIDKALTNSVSLKKAIQSISKLIDSYSV